MIWPLTKPASSEERKQMTLATSRGCPTRRTGIILTASAILSSGSNPMRRAVVRVISVSIKPGATALTVMPNCPSSTASVRVKPCKPAIFLLHHVFLCSATTEECSLEMDIHDCIPVVLRHFKEQIIANNACIIDEDVQPPEMVCRFINGVLHHGAIRYIARNNETL